MGDQIQTTYTRQQDRGQIGQISRPNAPYDGDRIQIGATGLKAGHAFKLDGSGKAIPFVDTADSGPCEGVLRYDIAAINTESVSGGQNLLAIPEYAVDSWVPYLKEGYIYVLAGEAVASGAKAQFDPGTERWVAQVTAQDKSQTVPQAWTAADELVEVKIGSRL